MKTFKRSILGAALLGTALSFATWNAGLAQTALPAIFGGEQAGQGIYIDAAFYNSIAGQPNVKLIDIRSPEDYAAGHIPGAINIPNTTLSITIGELRNQLPEWSVLEATFAAAGLSYDDTIVIYGDNLAGRSFIAFDQSGFQNLHILQGGFPEWTGATTVEATILTPSTFQLTNPGIQIVDAAYVLQNIQVPGVLIIDSRDADSFAAGHIPGSVNIPIGLTHDGATLISIDALVAQLTALGVTPETQIITTCGSGNVASNQLALLRDLGYTNIKLYDGSWQEWSADPSRPVATGA